MGLTKRFLGKVVLVTGAGSGMGKAVAELMVAEGARVLGVDRDADALGEALALLAPNATGFAADVSDEASMRDAVAAAVREFGRLDIAVNSAGIGSPPGPLVSRNLERSRRVLEVNLFGIIVCCKTEAAQMVKQGEGGVICNISSTNALRPMAGMGDYCASKAGVAMFTECAAIELAEAGIRVVAVGPGLTATPLVEGPILSDPERRAQFLDNIPLGRAISPDEIAASVAFLASEEAAMVTGVTLYVDGGLSTQRFPRLWVPLKDWVFE